MKSIKAKIVLLFAGLILFAGVLLSSILYTSSTKLIKSSIGIQALQIAQTAAEYIDLDQYRKIVERVVPEDEATQSAILEMPEYQAIRETLAQIREHNALEYLYTMALIDGQQVYVIDAYPLDEDDISMPGEVEEEEYDGLTKVFTTGQTEIGELSYDETWGAMLSSYVPLIDSTGQILGVLGADMDATDIYNLLATNRRNTIIVTTLIMLAFTVIAWLYANRIVRPIRALSAKVAMIRTGDLTVSFDIIGQDEIAQFAHAFKDMVNNLRDVLTSIDNTADLISRSSYELAGGAETAAAGAEQSVNQVQSLIDGSQQQVGIAHEANEVVGEMTTGISEIVQLTQAVANGFADASELANQGRVQVEGVGETMDNIQVFQQGTQEAISELGAKTAQIDGIVELIKEVAEQTNMLALNAAIEAARAGEAGRGFAVVADEVRKLADQSKQATAQIALLLTEIKDGIEKTVEQMNKSTDEVERGATSVEGFGSTFGSILDAITGIGENIDQVKLATDRLAQGNIRIVEAINEVEVIAKDAASSTQEFSRLIEEQGAVVEEVSASTENFTVLARELKEMSSRFAC